MVFSECVVSVALWVRVCECVEMRQGIHISWDMA